jgi:hypothetical protein
MLRPTVGGLAKEHFWSKDLKLFDSCSPQYKLQEYI